jgi:hypothetical protein
MYVGRTQIYLGDDEIALLEQVERTTGASRSELIRRAIHTAYAGTPADERLAALLETAGAWPGRKQTGAEIVETLRGSLDSRLAALGLD